MTEEFRSYLPLSPATLHILLALAAEDRHGYGIMQDIARQSEGKYKLGPGTLYDNLQKLMNQGMVEEAKRKQRMLPQTKAAPKKLRTEVWARNRTTWSLT